MSINTNETLSNDTIERISKLASESASHISNAYHYHSESHNPYHGIVWHDYEGDTGTLSCLVDEESQLSLKVDMGVGYGDGFSASTEVTIASPQETLTFVSGFAWPNKTFSSARKSGELLQQNEAEVALEYAEMVFGIFAADIAKKSLQKRYEQAKELEAITTLVHLKPLEVSEAVYFVHQN